MKATALWKKSYLGSSSIHFGVFLFHIFMCDLFTVLGENGFASYVDYNIPFVSEATTEYVVIPWKAVLLLYLNGFKKIKGNPEKCYLLIYTNSCYY